MLCICPNNMLLTTHYHNRIKHEISLLLRGKELALFKVVHDMDKNGGSKFMDIISFQKNIEIVLIIDPSLPWVKLSSQKNRLEKKTFIKNVIPSWGKSWRNNGKGLFGQRKMACFGSRGIITRIQPLKI